MSATRNAILARWAGGFFETTFPDSITPYGQRGGFVGISNVESGEAAFWTMLNIADQVSLPRQALTLAILPTSGDEPITDYNIGDRVSAYNSAGTLTLFRVAGISGSEDDNGVVSWTVELETAREIQEQRDRRWLANTANGTLDGRSPSTRLTIPSTVNAGPANVLEYSFSVGGMATTTIGDRGSPTRPREPGLVYRVELECDTAGASGSTSAELLLDNTAIATVTMTSGNDFGYADISPPVYCDETNLLNVETTAAGGHLGANLTALAVPTR